MREETGFRRASAASSGTLADASRVRGGRGAISWNIHEPAPSTPARLELLSQVSKDVNDAQITLGFLQESDFVSGQVGVTRLPAPGRQTGVGRRREVPASPSGVASGEMPVFAPHTAAKARAEDKMMLLLWAGARSGARPGASQTCSTKPALAQGSGHNPTA